MKSIVRVKEYPSIMRLDKKKDSRAIEVYAQAMNTEDFIKLFDHILERAEEREL